MSDTAPRTQNAAHSKSIADDQSALVMAEATLPVIDLAPLLDPAAKTEDKRRAAVELGRACEGLGFFYVVNHGVPQFLIDSAYDASRRFHAQPLPEKMKSWIGFSTNHRGYAPPEENYVESFPELRQHYETFDLSYEAPANHPDYVSGWRMTGPNAWPELPGFREQVSAYYEAVFELGRKLMVAFELCLQLPAGTLLRDVNTPTSQLRLLHYLENSAPRNETNMGIGAHSDFECFTILHLGGPGLQVMNADDHWVEAPPLPGAFIVNIGDCLEAWTGGRFKSTQHRVVNTGRERYSMPLFFGLDFDAVVQPLPQFRTPEAVAKYPPLVAGEHLMGMTVRSFRYLIDLKRSGHLRLDYEIPHENPFRREAKPLPGRTPT